MANRMLFKNVALKREQHNTSEDLNLSYIFITVVGKLAMQNSNAWVLTEITKAIKAYMGDQEASVAQS